MNTNTIIQVLNQFGTPAVQDAVTNYTSWFIGSNIIWIVFSLFLGAVGILIAKGKIFKDKDEPEFCLIVGLIIILTSATLFCACLEDLVNPRAIAIHQLITDITQ